MVVNGGRGDLASLSQPCRVSQINLYELPAPGKVSCPRVVPFSGNISLSLVILWDVVHRIVAHRDVAPGLTVDR